MKKLFEQKENGMFGILKENLIDLKFSEIVRPNGQIGTQGVDAENVKNILINIGKMKIPDEASFKDIIMSFKQDEQAKENIRKFMEKNPLQGYRLPDNTIQIEDGHHRAFLLYHAGDKTVKAEIR